jgi:hypothetical protein
VTHKVDWSQLSERRSEKDMRDGRMKWGSEAHEFSNGLSSYDEPMEEDERSLCIDRKSAKDMLSDQLRRSRTVRSNWAIVKRGRPKVSAQYRIPIAQSVLHLWARRMQATNKVFRLFLNKDVYV